LSNIDRRLVLKGIGALGATSFLSPVGDAQPASHRASSAAGALTYAGVSREHLFDDDWTFFRGDVPGAEASDFNDSTWRKVDLPHDWSIEDLTPTAEATGQGAVWVGGNAPTRIGPFDMVRSAGQEATGWVVGGTGWYRKRFRVAMPAPTSQVEIRFDGVYMNPEIWINGHLLGSHPYGYTPFAFNLTPYLHSSDDNVLAVRVRNEGQNSRWYSGSGIYRHVWLTMTGLLRIPLWGVGITTPQVSAEQSIVKVSVALENRGGARQHATVRTRILDANGATAGTAESHVDVDSAHTASAIQTINVNSPSLWSTASPHLYRAEVEVEASGRVSDRSSLTFGIRSIEVDIDHGLRINGEAIKLKGGCVHHDNGILGSAAFDRAEERRVEILKANGYNAIRTSHNPPSPAFLDACDRLGILVIDEIFDCWAIGKNGNDYHVYFNEWWQRDIDTMLMRDRNHPSIIFWSIGNEIDGRRDPSGVAVAKELRDAVKKVDGSRPVTMAVPGPYDHNLPEWQANDPAFLHLDVGGYNYQWQQYEIDHQRFPRRIMIGTESFPFECYESWRSAERLSYVLGDFVWTAIDYLGESAIGHSLLSQTPGWWRQQYPWFNSWCGDIDLIGDKKPQSYYRDVLWGRSSLEIAVQRPLPRGRTEDLANWGWSDELRSWTWAGCEGLPMKVRVYSSGDLVRLELNGKEVGSKRLSESDKLIARFEVPYAPGQLRAIALQDGKETARISLNTVRKPARIRLRADRQSIAASRGELAFVTIQITDDAEAPIPDLVRQVEFHVEGVGELAAVGNANPKDVASFREPHCRTFHGRSLAILRPTGSEGEITLRVQSDELMPASITIRCVRA
jgi:beta-galactosidase